MIFIRLLKQSKTDQWRKGITIVLGRTKSPLCPVSSFLSYIVVRGWPQDLEQWALLNQNPFCVGNQESHGVGRHGAIQFQRSQLPASTAAAHGMEDSLIKTLGRWESDAYQRYIRYIKIPREELANYTVMLTS